MLPICKIQSHELVTMGTSPYYLKCWKNLNHACKTDCVAFSLSGNTVDCKALPQLLDNQHIAIIKEQE